MAKDSNIVHQYYKKEVGDTTFLVKVNPIYYKGTEIIILPDGKIQLRELEYDEDISEYLKSDGFNATSALQFNLYAAGLL